VGESLAVRRIDNGHLKVSAAKNETTICRVNEVLSAFAERDCSLDSEFASTNPETRDKVLTAVRRFPARAAEFADWPEWVRDELRAAYASKGIARPYSHQASAAEAVHAGKNVVIVTPTASGKTLCYNLPAINAILENEDTRALYLFPTKALAQDQLAELYDVNQRLESGAGELSHQTEDGPDRIGAATNTGEMQRSLGRPLQKENVGETRHSKGTRRFAVFTNDGNTPSNARRAIRGKDHMYLTTPDMMHAGILPRHQVDAAV
jgi:DEAD/DEAH box helicase domain-containing protein